MIWLKLTLFITFVLYLSLISEADHDRRPTPFLSKSSITLHPTEYPTISYYYFEVLFPSIETNTRYPTWLSPAFRSSQPTLQSPSKLPTTLPLSTTSSLLPTSNTSTMMLLTNRSSMITTPTTTSPSYHPSSIPSIAIKYTQSPVLVNVPEMTKPTFLPTKQQVTNLLTTISPSSQPSISPKLSLNPITNILTSNIFIYSIISIFSFLLAAGIIYRNTSSEVVKLFILRFITLGFRSIGKRSTIIPLATIVSSPGNLSDITTTNNSNNNDNYNSTIQTVINSPSNTSPSNRMSSRRSVIYDDTILRRSMDINIYSNTITVEGIPATTIHSNHVVNDALPYDTPRELTVGDELDWQFSSYARLRENRRIVRGIPLDAVVIPSLTELRRSRTQRVDNEIHSSSPSPVITTEDQCSSSSTSSSRPSRVIVEWYRIISPSRRVASG